MKNTIRITGIVILTFIASASFGQSLKVSAGISTSFMQGAELGDKEYVQPQPIGSYLTFYQFSRQQLRAIGVNASLGYDFKLGQKLYLETGFRYQERVVKMLYKEIFTYLEEDDYPTSFASNTGLAKYSIKFIEVPIVLKRYITSGDVATYLRTGIYAGFITGGKASWEGEYTLNNGETSLSQSSTILDLSGPGTGRVSGGFIIGAGAEYKRFFFEANLNVGANFLSLYNEFDLTYTKDLSISLGFLID